jgi:hypothetical protein
MRKRRPSQGSILVLLLALISLAGYAAERQSTQGSSGSAPNLGGDLIGTWKPINYTVAGVPHKMRGLMIITPKFFMANTIFETSPGVWRGANANSGPYVIQDGKLVLTQWMQLHFRGEQLTDPKETFLKEGVVEKIKYRFENGRLVFDFPSGNHYVSERLGK